MEDGDLFRKRFCYKNRANITYGNSDLLNIQFVTNKRYRARGFNCTVKCEPFDFGGLFARGVQKGEGIYENDTESSQGFDEKEDYNDAEETEDDYDDYDDDDDDGDAIILGTKEPEVGKIHVDPFPNKGRRNKNKNGQ